MLKCIVHHELESPEAEIAEATASAIVWSPAVRSN